MITCAATLGASRVPTLEVHRDWRQHDYPVVQAAKLYLSNSYQMSQKVFYYLKEIVMSELYTKEQLDGMTGNELLEVMKKVIGSAPVKLKVKAKGVEAILAAQSKTEKMLEEAAQKGAVIGKELAERKEKKAKVPKEKKAPVAKVAKAKKAPAAKATKEAKAQVRGTGYKGHNPGSRKEQAHKLFDELGPDKARPKVLKLDIAPGTISSWFAAFAQPE
jgi:hypothetical protein